MQNSHLFSRICSRGNDFNRHKSNMKIWFPKQRYPENIIENEMKKVRFSSCTTVQRKQNKSIPFAVTYHSFWRQLEGILRRKHYLLNMNTDVKQKFTPGPLVSYRKSRKLSSYLERAKLYPLDRTVKSKCCAKNRCQLCVIVCETDTCSSTVTGETFKINHKLNCDNEYLVYVFMCKCCNRRYDGETSGEFSFRWNNYKCNNWKYTRNEDCF